jgi:hypothetical protein
MLAWSTLNTILVAVGVAIFIVAIVLKKRSG